MKRSRKRQREMLSDWLIVRCKANRERYAKRNIERAGHECFAPFLRNEGSSKEIPLFPGYIFAKGPDWYYLKTTFGVLGPIMEGPSPGRVPIAFMRELLGAADNEGTITARRERFEAGQPVRIEKGTFKGIVAVYIRASGRERVRLLLSLLGSAHELEFDRASVTAQIEPQSDKPNNVPGHRFVRSH